MPQKRLELASIAKGEGVAVDVRAKESGQQVTLQAFAALCKDV